MIIVPSPPDRAEREFNGMIFVTYDYWQTLPDGTKVKASHIAFVAIPPREGNEYEISLFGAHGPVTDIGYINKEYKVFKDGIIGAIVSRFLYGRVSAYGASG